MTKYKCWNSDDYYIATPDKGCDTDRQFFSNICANDPHSYQLCGQQICDNFEHSDNHYCGSYVCDLFGTYCDLCSYDLYFKYGTTCNKINQCSNGADERYCDWENKVKCWGDGFDTLDIMINKNQICDGRTDCVGGVEEIGCNHTFGIECLGGEGPESKGWQSPDSICDAELNCKKGEDEENCSYYNSSNATCNWCYGYNPFTNKDEGPRCLHPNQMCSHHLNSICQDHKDQLNCSNSIYTCPVHSYPTAIRDINLCDGYEACDDGFDEKCEVLGSNCKVHKNKLCDNVKDCETGEDETGSICNDAVDETCLRRLNNGSELPIPLEWLCDNFPDCINGIDEDRSKWKICGAGDTQRCVDPNVDCKELLICPGSKTHSTYVKNGELCDNFDTCAGENALCQVAHSSETVFNTVIEVNNVKHLSFCLPGFNPKGLLQCTQEEFRNIETIRVGAVHPQKLSYPTAEKSCLHVYGEQYVYYSCKNMCSEPNIPCPLRPIKYNSCPYSMRQKLYIPSNSQYLSLVEKNKGSYSNSIFPCDNGNCINYKQVCDLSDDCGDASDEENCKNHFRCKTMGKFIHIGGLCNGIIECFDRSDECNCGTKKRVINHNALKVFSWIAGGLATSINTALLVKHAIFLRKTDSKPPFTNTFLVMMIAIGDLLIGVYLLVVATADYAYSEDYCINEHKWLGSTQCSLIGIFSTIGSQVSLFSMTALSLFRAYSLSRMSAPGEVSLKFKVKIYSAAIVILSLSAALAIIPQIPYFEDYFINGLYYPDNPLFVGAVDKSQHVRTIQEYHGRVSTKEISWASLRILVATMFTQDNGTVVGKDLGFYSNDGVCLFKYFVNQDDPQKNFSLAVLLVNSVCFLIITTCYIIVNMTTTASSKASSSSNSNTRRLQQKITIIVLTDFICWVPFIVTCLLHFAGAFDATEYYGFFSIIVLPLNSVLNPIIYDGAIGNLIMRIRNKATVIRRSMQSASTDVTANPVAVTSDVTANPVAVTSM